MFRFILSKFNYENIGIHCSTESVVILCAEKEELHNVISGISERKSYALKVYCANATSRAYTEATRLRQLQAVDSECRLFVPRFYEILELGHSLTLLRMDRYIYTLRHLFQSNLNEQ